MKVIYDKQTGTLLDATHVLLGDIDPYEQSTTAAMVKEILRQDRPFLRNDHATDKFSEPGQFPVWVCYITDNYGNPIVAKVVSSENLAQQWISDEPPRMGKKDDDSRGSRYTEMYVVGAW